MIKSRSQIFSIFLTPCGDTELNSSFLVWGYKAQLLTPTTGVYELIVFVYLCWLSHWRFDVKPLQDNNCNGQKRNRSYKL